MTYNISVRRPSDLSACRERVGHGLYQHMQRLDLHCVAVMRGSSYRVVGVGHAFRCLPLSRGTDRTMCCNLPFCSFLVI